MDLSWEPSAHFPTLAHQAGIPADHITEAALAEFRSYWIGQAATLTQHQWDHKLLTNLKAQKVRSGQPPPGGGARASPRQTERLRKAQWAHELVTAGTNNGGDDGRTIDV